MYKKKVLLAIVGQYRTFKETKKYLLDRLIEPNSLEYDFDIVLNTDKSQKQVSDKPRPNYEFIDPNLIEQELRVTYGPNLKHIIFYEINPEDGNYIFFQRCDQVLEWSYNNQKNYDLYFFIRFDAILTETIILKEYPENQLTNLTGPYNPQFPQLHGADWDFCFFGNNKSVHSLLHTWPSCRHDKCDKCEQLDPLGRGLCHLNFEELIDFSKDYMKTGYIDHVKKIGKIDVTTIQHFWNYKSWCKFYEMTKQGIALNFKEGTQLIR